MFTAVPLLIAMSLSVQAEAAEVSVDFSSTSYTIPVGAFGINGFKATDPNETTSAGYVEKMKYMLGEQGGGFIRIHTWEMLNPSSEARGWLGSDEGWDAAKVQKAVGGLKSAGFNTMINIPAGPNGMDSPANFAKFCAALVRIVNVDGKLGVTHWELPNERDDVLKPAEHAAFYLAARDAMKAVDPTILVGGPAFQHAWRSDDVRAFLELTWQKVDFVSHHRYAGGGDKSDVEVWDSARTEYYSQFLRDYLDGKSPGKRIPIWYDEYNVSWTWQAGQAQMNGMCGAIYDALTMSYGLDHGADVLNSWNEKDGSYGKMNDALELRPAAHVLHMFNHYVSGERVKTTTSDENSVVPYASHHVEAGRYSLVLTNRTKSDQSLNLSLTQGPAADFECFRLVDSTYAPCGKLSATALSAGVTLPSESVTLLSVADGTGTGTGGSSGTAGSGSAAGGGTHSGGSTPTAGNNGGGAVAGIRGTASGTGGGVSSGNAGASDSSAEDSGCGCKVGPGRPGRAFAALAGLLGLALLLGRRRADKTRN